MNYVKSIVSKGLLKEDEEIIDGFIYCKNLQNSKNVFFRRV